jgi:predicted DCC family thiol-disulfide oxidoreductase YuxK
VPHARPRRFCFGAGDPGGDTAAVSPPTESDAGPVLLFDGECGLCQRVVRWLLRRDTAGRLRFAALQSAPAQAFLRARGWPTEDFDSLVWVSDWARRDDPETACRWRTDGVIAALRAVGATRWAALLTVVPPALRDAGYRVVARVRRRIFGPGSAGPLPRPEWTARFLS